MATISLAGPAANTLSAAMRGAIWQAFERVNRDKAIKAILLTSEGDAFSLGIDLQEPGLGQTIVPTLSQLCSLIEDCEKPVIAVLRGAALGAGAELVLAAHYRLGGDKARIGFRQVLLGLLPSAGSTQRLPRIVGAPTALSMLSLSQTIGAARGIEIGLLDEHIGEPLLSAADAFARSDAVLNAGPRPTRGRRVLPSDMNALAGELAGLRQRSLSGEPIAVSMIADCVEAAVLLPFEAGLAFEEDAYERCLVHPHSIALRHIFLAERQIAPEFLERRGGRFKPVAPAGRAIARRLRRHARAVAEAMVVGGDTTEAVLDGALKHWGFGKPVFDEDAPAQANAPIIRQFVAGFLGECADILHETEVSRPADLDALAVHGAAFPRLSGGPLRAAQTMGLLGLRKDMRRWATKDEIWAAPELLDRALLSAEGFDQFNR